MPSTAILQTNLVSDIPGMAQVTDPNLVNPWGLAYGPGGPFWVADNGTGLSTLYNGQGQVQSLVVTIPPPPGSPSGAVAAPTGTVFNSDSSAFTVSANSKSGSSVFLFATEDGTISGWSPSVDFTHAIIAVDNSGTGAVYKGLTIGTDSNNRTLLYAANFHAGTIDVFDKTFTPVTGGFQDPNIPQGFAPFDIQNLGGNLYVTYARQNAAKHDDVAGPGNGFVDVFNTDGVLLKRLLSHGPLNSPWGLAMAPAGFGSFSNDLLVGNFGDGHINAFNPANGKFVGEFKDGLGNPISINGLWSLKFGHSGKDGDPHTLFFTAGLNDEADGLFGTLQAVPSLQPGAALVPNVFQFPQPAVSTVPGNGDVNPYGVAFVPQDFAGGGNLRPGDTLVSNFNDQTNTQGTGTTIVRISPTGQQSVFFQGSPGLGLTTALGVLKAGFVLVGNVPNNNGTVEAGSLLILDSSGNVVEQLSDSALLDGPWDLTVNDQGNLAQVFVSNVLSGTVTRINLKIPQNGAPIVESVTQIASGYVHRPDPNALLVGPTGLTFDAKKDILYVASTGDNAVFALSNALTDQDDSAGMGQLVYKDQTHLHGPLGLVLAPNGDLIASNGDAVNQDPNQVNEVVEFTVKGQFVAQMPTDSSGTAGGAFGITLGNFGGEIRFAAVDDNLNEVLLQALPNLPLNSPIVPNLFVPDLAAAPRQTVSTVPASGDVNPYGVAFVPQGFDTGGTLNPGDILVSNFNDNTNTQGTGTTIMRITPAGAQSVFFQGASGLGLTTALGVLKAGFVIVGNVPNNGGNVGAGSLLIIDSKGNLVKQLTSSTLLNGPWDLTINDQGSHAQVFVSNVLSGTVTRINLSIPAHGAPVVQSMVQIASGYTHRPDPNALVVGPTGLAFDPKKNVLYVASTGDDAIYAISNALGTQKDQGKGKLVYQDNLYLHGPLGLVLAPNGDLIASNGDAVNQDSAQANEIVEFTPGGQFVGQFPVDASGTPGGAFGIALSTDGNVLRFAAVDDNLNAVEVWTFAD